MTSDKYGYDWYAGSDILLNAGEEKEFKYTYTITKETNDDIFFQISLGKIPTNNEAIDAIEGCKVEISNISIKQK